MTFKFMVEDRPRCAVPDLDRLIATSGDKLHVTRITFLEYGERVDVAIMRGIDDIRHGDGEMREH